MFHEPAQKDDRKDNAISFKTQFGIVMFFAYALIYSGFVAINVFKPIYMEKIVMLGLNLAVVYGFGLILLALAMAVVYNHFCNKKELKLN